MASSVLVDQSGVGTWTTIKHLLLLGLDIGEAAASASGIYLSREGGDLILRGGRDIISQASDGLTVTGVGDRASLVR